MTSTVIANPPAPGRSDTRKLPASYSHSSMATYEKCPKKFEYQKLDRLPDPPGRAMLLGTFAHAVLEDLMKAASASRSLDTARAIARNRWDRWFAHNKDFARLDLSDADKLAFRKDSWSAVEGYFAIEDPGGVDVVSVEKKVSVSVGGIPLIGYIDRIENTRDDPGGVVVTDYKSGKVPRAAFKGEALAQPHLYAAMLAESGSPVASYRMLYIAAAKEISGHVTDVHIASARQRCSDTVGAIEADYAAGSFATKTSILCDWCAYKEVCPAWH